MWNVTVMKHVPLSRKHELCPLLEPWKLYELHSHQCWSEQELINIHNYWMVIKHCPSAIRSQMFAGFSGFFVQYKKDFREQWETLVDMMIFFFMFLLYTFFFHLVTFWFLYVLYWLHSALFLVYSISWDKYLAPLQYIHWLNTNYGLFLYSSSHA